MFGGTFDPPHVGHLVTAVDAREQLDLDVVLMVVANEPWQKVGSRVITDAATRFEMVQRAVEGVDGLEACDLELLRGGPSYMVDTLDELAARFADSTAPEPAPAAAGAASLHLVLGADAAAGLHSWHRPADLAARCELVVVDRPGSRAEVPQGFSGVRLEVPRLDVSSSDLRCRAAEGRSLRFMVPDRVISLVVELGLYREER